MMGGPDLDGPDSDGPDADGPSANGPSANGPDANGPSANNLADAWRVIWASEAAALAVDRELAEATTRSLEHWAAHMAALCTAWPAPAARLDSVRPNPAQHVPDPAGRSGPEPTPGSAPADAPSGGA